MSAWSISKMGAPLGVAGILLALAFPSVSRAECANEQLRQSTQVSNTDLATGQPFDMILPDCRADEQVSPTEKEGGVGGVFSFDSFNSVEKEPPLPLRALETGTSITYAGEAFFHVEPNKRKNPELTEVFREQYTSERSANGWSTQDGDTLNPEVAPVPALPASAAGTEPKVLEEVPVGSKVFFLDDSDLVVGAKAAGEEPDLYEYKVPSPALPSGELVDLSIDKNAGRADVRGILGVGGEGAEEGSYVYFVAGGGLAPGVTDGECGVNAKDAVGAGCKLYMYHDGVTTFIATLSAEDEVGAETFGSSVLDWSGPNERTAEVSPNGRYVAFGSHVALTGEDPGHPQIFRYDADAAERNERPIVCVSCNPTGAAVTDGALNLVSTFAEINGADRQRYMLDDGRVLFDTTNALAPQDVNDQTDVYEWEPFGVGDCTTSGPRFSERTNGCLGLISGGTSDLSSAVLADASANGSDVFFTTNQSLVPRDQDEITDLYDAREGGGFPPPPEQATCPRISDCPGPAAPPPALGGAPASATFAGSESVAPGVSLTPPPTPRPLTRAQKLTKALKACHVKRDRKKRDECEAAARKLYGPIRHASSPKKARKK